MSKQRVIISGGVATAVILLTVGSVVNAMESDLVGLLTKQLGVTNRQAEGGAGAIFKEAANNMSADDFAKITEALPDAKALLNAAPALDTGTISGLTSTLGKAGGGVSSLAGLAGAFSQLGLKPDMVQQFMPIVLDYAESKGGETVANLLKSALL